MKISKYKSFFVFILLLTALAKVNAQQLYAILQEPDSASLVRLSNNASLWKVAGSLHYVGSNRFILKLNDNYYRLLDASGTVIGPDSLKSIACYTQGLIAAKVKSGWGFLDTNGVWIIKPKYVFVRPFSEGLSAAQIKYKNGFGFISRAGKVAIAHKYHNAFPFYDDRALVELKEELRFISKDGKRTTTISFEVASDYSEGLACVLTEDNYYAYIDPQGKIALPGPYQDAFVFREGRAVVQKRGLYGLIDKQGKEKISCLYQGITYVSNNRLFVLKEDRWLLAEASGAVHLDDEFIEVSPFKYGFAAVKVREGTATGWTVIDTEGTQLFDPIYAKAGTSRDGYTTLATASSDGNTLMWGVKDKSERWIIPPNFTEIRLFYFSDEISSQDLAW